VPPESNVSDNDWEKQLITTDGNLEVGESSMNMKDIEKLADNILNTEQARSKENLTNDFGESS
jgi:hypothetical protein